MLLAWTIIVLLILLTALYVAAEFATVSVRRSRLRRLAEDGNALAARLLPVVEDSHALDRYIAASQVGITLSSLILGAYGQAALAPAAEPVDPALRRRGRPMPRRLVRGSRRAPLPDDVVGDRRRAGAQVARPHQADRDGALHRAADAVVAPHLLAVDRAPERQRRAAAQAAPRAGRRAPARALPGGDRAADCREPGRRSAGTARAGAASPGAAARASHGAAVDGPTRAARGRRKLDAVRRGAAHRRGEPVQPSSRLPRLDGRSRLASCTRRTSSRTTRRARR